MMRHEDSAIGHVAHEREAVSDELCGTGEDDHRHVVARMVDEHARENLEYHIHGLNAKRVGVDGVVLHPGVGMPSAWRCFVPSISVTVRSLAWWLNHQTGERYRELASRSPDTSPCAALCWPSISFSNFKFVISLETVIASNDVVSNGPRYMSQFSPAIPSDCKNKSAEMVTVAVT
jgi:hypothetical protein